MHTAIGETLFAMAYWVEAVIPTEVGLPSLCIENYDEKDNAEQMMLALDLVKEKGEQALIRIAARNQVVARYYDKKF